MTMRALGGVGLLIRHQLSRFPRVLCCEGRSGVRLMQRPDRPWKGNTLLHTSTPMAAMQIDVSSDKSSFTARLPGWSPEDMNCLLSDLDTPWYLRVWRLLVVLDYLREGAKRLGYLDSRRYEESNFTYFKCVSLKRLVPVEVLRHLAGPRNLPYSFPVTMTSDLGRIGKSSFQLNHVVKASETQQPLFSSSIVHVAVDKTTRKVAPNPTWWVEKYAPCVQGDHSALRVDLQGLNPGQNICRSSVTVRPLDLDYYGHTTNTAYFQFAASALLGAQYSGHLDKSYTLRRLEEDLSYTELDFVSDTALGDSLETNVYVDKQEPNVLYCQIFSGDALAYVQKFVYECKLSHL